MPETILLDRLGCALRITLNRPERRNAMSLQMVDEILAAIESVREDKEVRALVLRGAGGHFCAGGDVADMAQARQAPFDDQGPDPVAQVNRRFGDLLLAVERAPQVVVAVLEGAIFGGGFGLACVSDVALATADARFAMPETTLGLPPAQIAMFVARRIGVSQARRLALTGARFKGHMAAELGLVHEVVEGADALDTALHTTLNHIGRCAPGALAVTKAMLVGLPEDVRPLDERLDEAARLFAEAVRSEEGTAGTLAFIQKQPPPWTVEIA